MDDADSATELPTDEKVWEEMVKNMLRAQMMLEGVSYAALAERLAAIGIHDNELNLRNKVGRGRFTAVFFMQCMKALGADRIKMPASVEEAAAKGAAQAIAKSSSRTTE
ncbi:MAG: hypothetical protein JST65_21950 [Acidobacteria bacterium]|nr:hypothetical protein [Acidobacteriota bacterium]